MNDGTKSIAEEIVQLEYLASVGETTYEHTYQVTERLSIDHRLVELYQLLEDSGKAPVRV